jgi:DNA-binding IscR family transcriptional regulator
MQISTKFTIAVHILMATKFFSGSQKITSQFLAGSIGSNPVIIRNIMLQMQEAGIIDVKRGTGGITVNRPLSEITYLDIYRAVETKSEDHLFRFHEKPNPQCPVGRNIHKALEQSLDEIQRKFEKELSEHNLQDVFDKIKEAVQKTA